MIKQSFIKLKAYWSSTGTKSNPPASSEDIVLFESQNGVILPQDLCEYFQEFNGMQENEFDGEMFSFWSLKKIKPVPEILAEHGGIPDYREIIRHLPVADSYFIFADYFIFSHVYAIHLSQDSTAKNQILWIGGGTSFYVIADSFSDFLEKYLDHPSSANNSILFPVELKSVAR